MLRPSPPATLKGRSENQPLPDTTYTAEEVDAAVEALLEPDRLRHAQEVVTHAAPGLQRVLNAALDEGGWFGSAQEEQVARAAASADPEERARLVRTLLADETRLGMLVGVAVGFELASALESARATAGSETTANPSPEDKES
jgi:hypothetical protein